MEYEISELGRSLAPPFHSLSEWSVRLPEVEAARVAYDARTEVRAEKGY